ncbi:esterase 6-like [Amblyomma americanum]
MHAFTNSPLASCGQPAVSAVLVPFLLLLVLVAQRCEAQQSPTQQVTTNYGAVTGNLIQAPLIDLVSRVPVYAFQGIRYAKPPVGRRRFERPEPIDQRPYDSHQPAGRRCLQWTSFPSESIVGEEDCLYLDIYVPATYFAAPATKFPVVVFFPGADFKSGGKDDIRPGYGFGATNIFVVVNYRLGVFGFLSTEDESGKGNMGLWDQQMALQFVKSNIASFGGDPTRVTLMGFGAGAMSVAFHMLNPASSALFARAIMSGGSATSPEATLRNAWRNARQLGRSVGCSQEDGASLVSCLRVVDAVKLVDRAYRERIRFLPIVDANITLNAFVKDYPRLLYCQGRFAAKPTIYGYTEHAGSLRYFERIKEVENSKSIEQIVQTYLGEFFEDEDSRVGVTAAVRFQYYRPRSSLSNATRNAINTINMLTDFLVGAPVEMALSGHLKQLRGAPSYATPSPAYMYIFGLPNAPRTFANLQRGPREPYGATYMDDMLYSVNTEGILQTEDATRDRPIVSSMNGFFMNFINGQSPLTLLPINPAARQYNNMSLAYPAGISDTVPYRPQEMDFWNYFVPDLHLELNRTSWASYHNAREATHFKAATWGTTTLVVLLVLIIVGLLAAFFVYRRQKRRSRKLNAREGVEFRPVSQDVKL